MYSLAWVPVALMAVALKRKILTDEGGGYDIVADSMGVGNGSQLTAFQQLALYRWDAIIALVAVPLLWVWLLHRMSARSRFALSALGSVVVTLILFIELKTYWEVGTFLPAGILAAGVFGAGRAYAADYLSTASVAKLVVLLAASVFAASAAFVVEKRRWKLGGLNAISLRSATVMFAVAGALLAVLPPHLPRTSFSRSGMSIGLLGFAGVGNTSPVATDLDGAGPEQLLAAYREISSAPVPNDRSEFFGSARGYNVLIYLYETLPLACSRMWEADTLLTNFRKLERNGFTAQSHYATYPYSRRAYFSIYSGWYPAHGMREYLDFWEGEDPVVPGLVSSARAEGYSTMAFVPEVASEWENDVRRYRSLGFQQHVVPPNAELALAPRAADERVAWQRKRDDDARAMLVDAIRKEGASGRPWLAAFNPQLTHGPWPGAASVRNETEICARGLPLFQEVDAGLGEVLAALDSSGQRERTLVVALGDHGLRTTAEYPGFRGATLDDITFHVPLVIHVPKLLPGERRIEWPTSHVDIAPSVLDLLGISGNREAEQGSPMWDPRLTGRRIFVYAQGYLGADGFVDAERAVMLNYFLGGIAQTSWNGKLRFEVGDLLDAGGATADSLAAILHRSVALQRLFMTRLSVTRPGAAAAAH